MSNFISQALSFLSPVWQKTKETKKSVVIKDGDMKNALLTIKMFNETMYIILDDLITIQYNIDNKAFLIDDRNFFYYSDKRIVTACKIFTLNDGQVFVLADTVEKVIEYLDGNFKFHTFDKIYLAQLITETVSESNKKFSWTYESLSCI